MPTSNCKCGCHAKISEDEYQYVWEYYNTDTGMFKKFFESTGLTINEVRFAVDLVCNTEVYHGSVDTMVREVTRDLLYWMKGIAPGVEDPFPNVYEYDYFIKKNFLKLKDTLKN